LGQTAATPEEKIENATWDDDPYYVVALAVHKSRRYHMKMCAFYQSMNDFVLGANALLGASAFVALIGGENTLIAQILIGIVAALSAVDNVLGFGKKAKLHADLSRRFTDLAANMALWDATEDNHRRACAERIKIEKDEPPIRRLIDLDARNDELRSRGYDENDMVPLGRLQRILGYGCTFGMKRLEAWRAARHA
jgi:hypothetical protein